MNSPVEKAAPFSTLRSLHKPLTARKAPIRWGEGWGEGAPHKELTNGKGCAVFHATKPAQALNRSESPLSLGERAGVRARLMKNSPTEKIAPFSTLRGYHGPSGRLRQHHLVDFLHQPVVQGAQAGIGQGALGIEQHVPLVRRH